MFVAIGGESRPVQDVSTISLSIRNSVCDFMISEKDLLLKFLSGQAFGKMEVVWKYQNHKTNDKKVVLR